MTHSNACNLADLAECPCSCDCHVAETRTVDGRTYVVRTLEQADAPRLVAAPVHIVGTTHFRVSGCPTPLRGYRIA